MFPLTCKRCGRIFSSWQWARLPLVGYQRDEEETLELRTCNCGSTHSVPVEQAASPAHQHRDAAIEALLLALKADTDAKRAEFAALFVDEATSHAMTVMSNVRALKEATKD